MIKRFISDINTRLTKNGSFLYNKSQPRKVETPSGAQVY